MLPTNPKAVFAAKVALEEYKEKKGSKVIHFDKVIKAEQRSDLNGCTYHVNFRITEELNLFPAHICDAFVYENEKGIFYVKKVLCNRYVFW